MSEETAGYEVVPKYRKVVNTNLDNEHTEVLCLDGRGAGGMCHEYIIVEKDEPIPTDVDKNMTSINFQNGPIQENGVNGCQNEDLILVVLDRLRGAQQGNFSCRENALAITKLEEALLWLNYRTNTRIHQQVEGKNEPHESPS